MSRFKTKSELIDEIKKERRLFDELLASIPEEDKAAEVTEGMTVKDFVAHRTEWGRMMIDWYLEARAGREPQVPTKDYKWNQLKELNQAIKAKFEDTPVDDVERDFSKVHNRLQKLVDQMDEDELLERHRYKFTGTSDLATYVNSATASNYRSARRHIQKWWRARSSAR